jgi:predicted ATPase
LGLVGRDRELAILDDILDRISERGSAAIIRGEPGIGKSALLSAASRHAVSPGIRQLRMTGSQAEANLPFAGLHQLLRPILGGLDALPDAHRQALFTAFGLVDAAAPDIFKIAMAALDLLAEIAAQTPLLLIVEDAHWLDRSTLDVLAFVARRLQADPIVLLVATRDGYSQPWMTAIQLSCDSNGSMTRTRLEYSMRTRPSFLPRCARACSPRLLAIRLR